MLVEELREPQPGSHRELVLDLDLLGVHRLDFLFILVFERVHGVLLVLDFLLELANHFALLAALANLGF